MSLKKGNTVMCLLCFLIFTAYFYLFRLMRQFERAARPHMTDRACCWYMIEGVQPLWYMLYEWLFATVRA